MRCTHLDQIVFTEPPDQVEGCVECLRIGGQWGAYADVSELRDRRLL